MSNALKRICVFCGSSLGKKSEYRVSARELGKILGVDAIIFGSVDDYSLSWIGLLLFSKASINVKCVHVESGTVLTESLSVFSRILRPLSPFHSCARLLIS